jgi:hypothetical protein
MSTRSLRNKVLPLLLCAGLLAPWASAATPRRVAQTAAPDSLPLLDRAWSFLQSLWGEEGCMLDPSGRCATHTTQAPALRSLRGETGCMLDPSGRCLTGTTQVQQPSTDSGCMLDPNGRCHS